VKAFNTTFAGTLVEGEVAGQQLDVLIAGDDEQAKQKVSQLVAVGGLRPIDVGPLAAHSNSSSAASFTCRYSNRTTSTTAARSSCFRDPRWGAAACANVQLNGCR
jgi:predicted dinucleotide-binding enzyme